MKRSNSVSLNRRQFLERAGMIATSWHFAPDLALAVGDKLKV